MAALTNNRIFLKLSALVLFMGLGFLLGLIFLKIPLTENLFIHHGPQTYPLSGNLWLEQSFIPKRDKLLGFDLVFKRVNDVEHPVLIEIFKKVDEKHSLALYRGRFSSKEIKDNQFYSFWLSEPLAGKGEKFWFYFRADASTSSASISPVISRVDNYLEGETITSLEGKIEGDIVFRPIYQVKGVDFISYYINRIVFGKPPLFNKFSLAFLFFLWGLILASFLLLLAGFYKNQVSFKKLLRVIFLLILIFLIFFYTSKSSFILNKVGLP